MRQLAPTLARSIAIALVTLAAVTVAGPSVAQTVYKSTLSDGRIVYGGKPEKGASKVEKLVPAAPIVEVDPREAEAQRQRERAQVEQLDKRLAARRAAREKADGEVLGAKDAAAAAEKALAAGKEPLPGERVATADGGSRLSQAYLERVDALVEDVKSAKERIEKALRDRTALD
jgi:hypothetical protein